MLFTGVHGGSSRKSGWSQPAATCSGLRRYLPCRSQTGEPSVQAIYRPVLLVASNRAQDDFLRGDGDDARLPGRPAGYADDVGLGLNLPTGSTSYRSPWQ